MSKMPEWSWTMIDDRIWPWRTGASTELFPDDAKTYSHGNWTAKPSGDHSSSYLRSTPVLEHAEEMRELLAYLTQNNGDNFDEYCRVLDKTANLLAKIKREEQQ